MEIKKIDHHNLSDINKPNQPFEIIGKIMLLLRIYVLRNQPEDKELVPA